MFIPEPLKPRIPFHWRVDPNLRAFQAITYNLRFLRDCAFCIAEHLVAGIDSRSEIVKSIRMQDGIDVSACAEAVIDLFDGRVPAYHYWSRVSGDRYALNLDALREELLP